MNSSNINIILVLCHIVFISGDNCKLLWILKRLPVVVWGYGHTAGKLSYSTYQLQAFGYRIFYACTSCCCMHSWPNSETVPSQLRFGIPAVCNAALTCCVTVTFVSEFPFLNLNNGPGSTPRTTMKFKTACTSHKGQSVLPIHASSTPFLSCTVLYLLNTPE